MIICNPEILYAWCYPYMAFWATAGVSFDSNVKPMIHGPICRIRHVGYDKICGCLIVYHPLRHHVVIKVFIIIKAHTVYLIYLIDCGSVELNAIKTHSFCNSTGDTKMRKGRCTISVSLL